MAFRAARSPVGLMRTTAQTVITTYGRDFAVASTLFHRDSAPGKVGRQMQTWVRFPGRLEVVAAHVSIIDEPQGSEDMSLDDLPTRSPPAPSRDHGSARRPPSPQPDKVTRAEELRLQLADEIVRGVLPPGAALDETEIARRFSVSRTPVREAMRQLVASGLVDARAHRGAVVARPSIERLTGMFEAMAELEALCAGWPPSA